MALITRRMWTDDGRYMCNQYHAVRAGFGYCLQRLTPVTHKYNVRTNYVHSRGRDALVAAWASLGL
eukprot:8844547-Pyramimonas_sp.AAC.1